MTGHTGGAITMGTGIIHGKASKQKMNSKSTNETEVIGDSEYLPYVIRVEYFMDEQGRKSKGISCGRTMTEWKRYVKMVKGHVQATRGIFLSSIFG